MYHRRGRAVRRGRTVTGRSHGCHGTATSRWQDCPAYGGTEGGSMPKAILTINSRNYGAWSMRCWLLCRMSSLEFEERIVSADDASTRAAIAPAIPFVSGAVSGDRRREGLGHPGHCRVPQRDSARVPPAAGRPSGPGPLPVGKCRAAWRLSQPPVGHAYEHQTTSHRFQTVVGRRTGHRAGDRDLAGCLHGYRGPWLFGAQPTMADAMYAPECTRFRTYKVTLDAGL